MIKNIILLSIAIFIMIGQIIAVPTFSTYDVTNARTSGYGGWGHSYYGTITMIGSGIANYSGGSGSLNDGITETANTGNTQLFWSLDNPVITLHLDTVSTISNIEFHSWPSGNGIPGTLRGARVTIGGVSVDYSCVDFGTRDDRITLNSSQNNIATNTVQLSNWIPGYSSYFSISELTLNGNEASVVTPNLSVTNTNFGNVRVGTSANASVTVTNTGQSGSTLTGNIGAASGSEFSPNSSNQSFSLGQNQSSSRTFTYTPANRGNDSTTVTVSSNEDGNSNATLTSTGVSPVFNSSVNPGTTIDFGMIHLNSSVQDHPDIPPTKYETITISNITADADLGNLTDLSILNAYITGDGIFDIIDFTPTVLGKNGTLELTIRYSTIMAHNGGVAPSKGIKNAVLTLVTDQNAAFGQNGDVFTFNLTGEVVPEPGTIFLLSFTLIFLFPFAKLRKKTD